MWWGVAALYVMRAFGVHLAIKGGPKCRCGLRACLVDQCASATAREEGMLRCGRRSAVLA
jgi:hypothetical protein